MSKFPWETAGQKKEGEQNAAANAAPGSPPFAPGAQVPDIFQKAFSGSVMQETSIAAPEKSSSKSSSEVPPPLFSMGIPDLSSLQSGQQTTNAPIPPFLKDGGQGSLPPFLSQEPSMAFPAVHEGETKNPPKAQTAKNRILPLFEMALPDDVPNDGGPIQAHEKLEVNSSDLSKLNAQDPNISGTSPFSLPVSPTPGGNISSSPQRFPVFDTVVPSPQNEAYVPTLAPSFPPLQGSVPSDQHTVTSGSGSPFDPIPGKVPNVPFPGTPSAFSIPGNPPAADIFSASRDPFAQGIPSSAADPFAGQANPFGGAPGPSGPAPFPFSGPNPSFSDGPTPGSVTTVPEKKPGIGGRMADVPGNLATSISELANSIVVNVRNLTKGKSLLEKMEKIKEGNVHEEDNSLKTPDALVYEGGAQARGAVSSTASNASPFGPAPSGSLSFTPSGGGAGFSIPAPQFAQDGLSDDHAISISPGDFVKVTPVENPLFDFPEALKIDNNSQPPLPAYNDLAEGAAGMQQGSSDTLYQSEKVAEEVPFPAAGKSSKGCAPAGSRELDDIREKLESSAGNISQVYGMYEGLSGNVAVLGDSVRSLQSSSEDMMKATGMKFDNLDERIVRLESHLSGMEQQVAHVLSENKTIMSSLSSIEQHISELVGSYTALVSKIQENAQENDERFSALSAKAGQMETLVPRLAGMERSGVEMSAAMQDMKGNVLKLGNDVSNVSAAQQGMRDEMTELSKYVEGELKKVGARGKSAGQSIQLAHIMKNSSSIKLCMEWLEFLMELVGRNNLPDILSYYEELGWITEEVRMELMRYAEGIDFYMEKPDWKLTPDDHVKSIWFIENLAGIKVDKNKLSVIDRDIEKVRKSSEIYNI
ncbi:FlaD/FlaE family flagellar protein [uncultured Methanomethylovorans sp.]|uniref:FlaD/FlaE family flagellar protein n=1 Tax=uncultured Methanomethylovorans sp. TaxID=183759 RepID=UPI00262614CB|nr:FlaD/FlaE family flagellar protein [uncultured Methanomethylovorans sp.]